MNFWRSVLNWFTRQRWRQRAPDADFLKVIEINNQWIYNVTHAHEVIAALNLTRRRNRCHISLYTPVNLMRLTVPAIRAISKFSARNDMAGKNCILTSLTCKTTEY